MPFDAAAIWKRLGVGSPILRRRLTRAVVSLIGITALALLGWVGVTFSRDAPGDRRAPQLTGDLIAGLERFSYDLPFHWRPDIETPELSIIYLDDKSADGLAQGDRWSRALHARLVRHLTEDGAKAIVFDVVFGDPSGEEGADGALAAAIRAHGHVYLGGALDLSSEDGQNLERITPPYAPLRKAAAGWGLLVFRPVDQDYGVRQIYSGSQQKAAAVWVAAQGLGAPFPDTPEERARVRYLNYYGPTGTLDYVSYIAALTPDGKPPGYFKNKIVLIGGRSNIGPLHLGKDEFATPYTRRGIALFSPGVDIHATALLNLLRGDWLTRLPYRRELLLVLAVAVVLGTLFSLLPPLPSVLTGLAVAVGLIAYAFPLAWHGHAWFNWVIPVGLQIPIGLAWSLGANYFFVRRQDLMLSRAFSRYLSPEMVKRIKNSEVNVELGGKEVTATVMFTDLKGFAGLADDLEPEKLGLILTTYFTQVTEVILNNNGTIIKFIGDAVLAVWGAPLPDAQQQIRALRAAQCIGGSATLSIEYRDQVEEYTLTTRVGVHTGQVLAGNLGSARRFDYTVIGDAVNLASRFESLNKHLRTSVILSEESLAAQPEGALTRRLGKFCVVGKKSGLWLHELLPLGVAPDDPWLEFFARAVELYVHGDLTAAQTCFAQASAARAGGDGPSEFYCDHITTLLKAPLPSPWLGVVEMVSK